MLKKNKVKEINTESDAKKSRKGLSASIEKKKEQRAEKKAEKERIKKEEQKKSLKMGLLMMGIVLLICVGMYFLGGTEEESAPEEPVAEENTDGADTNITEEPVKEESPVEAPAIGDDINTVGNRVVFGEYEGQKIYWWVCETSEGKSLLVSADKVTEKAFNDTVQAEATDWRGSTLREFLNDTFLNEAFNNSERQCVIESEVADEGETTYDKVFILNEKQYREYYAITKVRFQNNCWLMDSVVDSLYRLEESDIGRSGEIDYGLRVNENCGVRPAIWVDTELFKDATE